MKIFLAAAHGGRDPGAVANNTTEANEVSRIVQGTIEILIPQIKPPNEIIQVPNEYDPTEEVYFINAEMTDVNKDICIEVNMNSNTGDPGTGIETYYGNQKLANTLQKNLVRYTGLKDRGVKEGNKLYFNNQTLPASALVELGFINNTKDLDTARRTGAEALAHGIAEYIGITLPGEPKNENKIREILEQLKQTDAKIDELKKITEDIRENIIKINTTGLPRRSYKPNL